MNPDKPLHFYDRPRKGVDITAATSDSVTLTIDPFQVDVTGSNASGPTRKQPSKKAKARKKVRRKMSNVSRRKNRRKG
jgi:hypothetical protein